MNKTSLPFANEFENFSLLCMNEDGRFVKPADDLDEFIDGFEVEPNDLPDFFKENIVLPDGVTDVFVWVHGWQNTHESALTNARRLFNGITELAERELQRYSKISTFNPAFIVVRWPSQSSVLPSGYRKIRNRAMQLIEDGYAEFFLASLLGYLDQKNQRVGGQGSKTLAAAGGFYVHCIGHSFGGRFLTAAVKAAADPLPQTLSLMNSINPEGRLVLSAAAQDKFEFTVDSMLVFQMAAPSSGFSTHLSPLIHESPFRGPLVTTFSDSDTANCFWHTQIENEKAIGCCGVAEPQEDVSTIVLAELSYDYVPEDFSTNIVNVNASDAFNDTGPVTGAHSDYFYEESIHLLLSLVNHVYGII